MSKPSKWCNCRHINKTLENVRPVINQSGWYLLSTIVENSSIRNAIHSYKELPYYGLKLHQYAYFNDNRWNKYDTFTMGDWMYIPLDETMNRNLAYWIYVYDYLEGDVDDTVDYPPNGFYPFQIGFPPTGSYPAQTKFPPMGNYPNTTKFPPPGMYPAVTTFPPTGTYPSET